MTKTKQVIVMRTDLRNTKGEKVRTGKLIAQGAHASLKAILDLCSKGTNELNDSVFGFVVNDNSALDLWLSEKFTKICLSISSEKELLEIYQKAKDKGLICALIQDAGDTEFGGVPTYTCCAIGPDFDDNINELTGHLKLL